MWLLYLRFDDQGTARTYHVRAPNQDTVQEIVRCAEQRGLSASARLIEYASFIAGASIRPKAVPNFHYYEHDEFLRRWKAVGEGRG